MPCLIADCFVENDWSKVYSLRCRLGVSVGKVSIDFADQNSAVAVSDPFGNRHVINSRHDAEANEQVPHVMKANVPEFGVNAGEFQRFPKAHGVNILVAALR